MALFATMETSVLRMTPAKQVAVSEAERLVAYQVYAKAVPYAIRIAAPAHSIPWPTAHPVMTETCAAQTTYVQQEPVRAQNQSLAPLRANAKKRVYATQNPVNAPSWIEPTEQRVMILIHAHR